MFREGERLSDGPLLAEMKARAASDDRRDVQFGGGCGGARLLKRAKWKTVRACSIPFSC
jgi:hypothetical protein